MAAATPSGRINTNKKRTEEPSPSGTSWTSMRWPTGHSGAGNIGYTKTRLMAAAAKQTSNRTMTPSPTKINTTVTPNVGTKSKESNFIGSLRSRFGEAVSRTTAPILSFTNKINPGSSSSQKDSNIRTDSSRQIIKGTVHRMPTQSSSSHKSAATEEYAKALKRHKQTTHNEPSTSTKTSANSGMPEVLSRFGSRNPAFLAGGVIRTVPINYTSGPTRSEPQPSIVLTKPIPKAERPWRQRLADSARLRNLEEDVAVTTHSNTLKDHQLTLNHQSTTRRGSQVVSASTPTSSVALRNYESKFQSHKYNDTPTSSRPTSLVLPSSTISPSNAYLASKYKPRSSLTPSIGIHQDSLGGQLSRNSSVASTNTSLLSAMPSSVTSRFRSSTAAPTKTYTPPILSRYPLGISTSGRRISSNAMSRSYTPSYASPATPRVNISTTYTNYGNYRSSYNRDEKRTESTEWRPVENRPTVYERSPRRDRSSSITRKRRSRSKTNEPPPPGSSSDEEKQKNDDEERVPPRVRRLRKKSNSPARAPPQQQGTNNQGMPAVLNQYAAAIGDNDGVSTMPDVFTAKDQQNYLPQQQHATNKNDLMDTSIHSTITNTSEMAGGTLDDELVDETKFNAVTSFKPAGLRAKRRKSPKQEKPVPGIWPANTANELNISQNKNFRRNSDHIIVEITMKHFPYAKASTAHFRMPRPRKQSLLFRPFATSAQKQVPVVPPKVESKTISASFMRPKFQNLSTHVTFKNKKPTISTFAQLKLKEPGPKPLRVTAESTIQQYFTNKRRLKLGIEKAWRLKGKTTQKVHLNCKSTTAKGKNLNLNIQRKPEIRACNGTVKDEQDVVFARVSSKGVFQAPVSVKVTLAQPPKIFSPTQQYDGLSSPEPYEPNLHIPIGRNDHQGGPLVLPDRSVLEEYVKRKRSHLEILRRKNYPDSSDNSIAESPPPTANTTELQKPCPVRILEPHIAQAHITTPTRTRLSSAEPLSSSGREQSMTPRPNEGTGNTLVAPMRHPLMVTNAAGPQSSNAQQLAAPQQPTSGGFFRGVLRKTSDPTGGSRLKAVNVFDTPKSPFEERMQQQANQLRKTSVGSSDTENEGTHKNRASINGEMAQHFVSALAQQQPARHERYAAHIPVQSGRQSVTSIESTNSGALDTASRQLDQMIDQARYKHQQHRTKFKEAIDYLDQIFEDLKKECEPNSPPKSNESQQQLQRQNSQRQQQLKPKPFPVSSNTTQPNEKRLQKSVSQDAGDGRPIQQQKMAPNARVIQPQPPTHQQRLQVSSNTQQSGPAQSFTQRHPLKKQRSNIEGNEGRDIEVNETIVLPSKNKAERLDFTRQWLKNDIRGWVEKPSQKGDRVLTSPDQQLLLRQNSSGADSDEHSLGSCSAEVAAINIQSTQRTRKHHQQNQEPKQAPIKKPTIIQNEQPKVTTGPLKPRAYRPQPQQPNQIVKNVPITVLNAPDTTNTAGYELQKVPSQKEMTRSPTHDSMDRPGSQDYQSLGSTHSQEGSRPNFFSNSLQRSVSGAFVQYPQRGSIQSLPDAVLVAGNVPTTNTLQPNAYGAPLQHAPSNTSGYGSTFGGSSQHVNAPPPDPAVQALMAELDMNSGPGFQPNVDDQNPDDPEEKRRSFPTTQNDVAFRNKITVQRPVPTRLGVPQQPAQTYAGSMDRGMTKMQQQMVNPFTNRVLGSQKRSPPPPDPTRQQFEDAANLLDSVIGELQPVPKSPTQKQRQQFFRPQQQAATRQQSNFVPIARPQPLPNNGQPFVANVQPPPQHSKPFETINAEKMNPSRVEKMHKMFERPGPQQQAANVRQRGTVATNRGPKENDPTYSEIGEFQRNEEAKFQRTPSFKNSVQARPAFPESHPPPNRDYIPQQSAVNIQRVPSASSRQQFKISSAPNNNDYTSIPVVSNTYAQYDAQSSSANEATMDEDEEGGFYDNIQNLNAKAAADEMARQGMPPSSQMMTGARFGQPAPFLGQSVPPQPPPHKFLQQPKNAGARIGQLIRKLGGVAERPLVQQTQHPHAHHLHVDRLASSGSVLSLNRITQDQAPKRAGMLMKSNSLSHEPWRIYAMDKELTNSASNQSHDSNKSFGNRLKQTIFGSKKWLNNS